VNVSGTVQCTQGDSYRGFVSVRQTTGNRPYNGGEDGFPVFAEGMCSGEVQDFTTTVVGQLKPFKKGTVLVSGGVTVCEPAGGCFFTRIPYEEFRLLSDYSEAGRCVSLPAFLHTSALREPFTSEVASA
jgi:hypothetical protein